MSPVLIEIPGVKLHGYGVAIATALLLALWLAGCEAQRKGLGSRTRSHQLSASARPSDASAAS